MNPALVGMLLVIAGLLQAGGAYSGSRLFQALPHFQRSKRLFGSDTSIVLHVIFGLIGASIGVMVMAGIIVFPPPK